MKWLNAVIIRLFKHSIESIVQESLDLASKTLYDDLDTGITDEQERRALKSGASMYQQRVLLALRERL